MPATHQVNVLSSPTQLPFTVLARKSVMVENQGGFDIFVSTNDISGVGNGHVIAPNTSRTFPGVQLWAACSVAQGGGAGDQTIVSEFE